MADEPPGSEQAPAGSALTAENPAAGPSVGTFALFGAISSGISILAAIVRSKVTAHAIGPAGLGVFAEAQQIFTLGMTLTTVAAGPALITRLARDLRDGRKEEAGRAVGASLLFGAALGSVTMVGAGLAYPYAVSAAAQRPLVEIASLGFATLLGTVGQAYGALFTAQARVRQLTAQATVTAVLSTGLHAALVLSIGVPGQFYAALGSAVLSALTSLYLARSCGVRVHLQWDGAFARTAISVGSTSLVAALLAQSALTSVRLTLDRVGGHAQGSLFNGQYQAALTIGLQYFTVVTTGLGSYFFPRYAAARTPEDLQREIGNAASFALRIAPPIVLAMLAVRGPIIHLLYTDRFDGAVSILGYQLAGDIAKGLAWAYAGPLIYRGELKGFLITESSAAIMTVGFSIFLIPIFGLAGAGMAYAASYLVYLFVAAWVTTRVLGVHLRRGPLWLGALGTVCAGLSEVARSRYARVDVVLFFVALIWAWRGGLIALVRARVTGVLARLHAR